MKTVLKRVLADLGIEFSIIEENLNIYPSDWCNKRDELKV